MLKNNNQTAIKKISRRMLRGNKTRNIIMIIAIVLTTYMYTTVFTIGFSMIKNINQMMLRQQGSKATISLQAPNSEQIEKVKKLNNVYAAGIQTIVDQCEDSNRESYDLVYYDSVEFNENYKPAISKLYGTYPVKENQVMMSVRTLELMGIKNPKVGMNITLCQNEEEKTFELSGYYTDYVGSNVKNILVSKKYMENHLSGNTDYLLEDGSSVKMSKQQAQSKLSISAKESKQGELTTQLEDINILEKYQKWDVNYDVQSQNLSNALVAGIGIGMLALIILVSGYLLIYNVMNISVTKDTRFYGMLKTLGTSPSQIKKIVKKQSGILAGIGIPIGVGLGTATSFGIAPMAMTLFSANREELISSKVSFNPCIYVISVLVALLTIAISFRKPARAASKISPIEALKYQGEAVGTYKQHNGTSGGKLHKMAWRNIFREKKRTILVFASLFMGTIAFLSVNTFVGCLSPESYIDNYLPNDYGLYVSNSSDMSDEKYQQEVNNLIADVKNVDGIKDIQIIRNIDGQLPFDEAVYGPFLKGAVEEGEYESCVEHFKQIEKTGDVDEGAYSAPVIAVGEQMIKTYNKKARQKIDIDDFNAGKVCILGYAAKLDISEEMLGKKISIKGDNGKTVDITIGSVPLRSEEYGLNVGYYWCVGGAPDMIIVSDKVLDQLTDENCVNCIIADAKYGREPEATLAIKNLIKKYTIICGTDIKSEEAETFKSSMLAMDILGSGISFILIMIGIINFINVMLTGVYTRSNELAVMESVGMTKKQICKMLCLEGMFYGIITIGLILTIGSAILYLVGKITLAIADYAIFTYPVLWIALISCIIMLICFVVPRIVYRKVARASVTERIRTA